MTSAHIATLAAHFKIIFTYRGMMLIQAVRLILLPLVLAAAWLSIQKTAENPYSDADYLLYYLLVPVILNLTDSRLVFRFPMAGALTPEKAFLSLPARPDQASRLLLPRWSSVSTSSISGMC